MPWERRRFKGNKVYVRVDEAGGLALENGKAELRYKLGDARAYPVPPQSLSVLPAEEGGGVRYEDERMPPAEVGPPAAARKKSPAAKTTASPAASINDAQPSGSSVAPAGAIGRGALARVGEPGSALEAPPYLDNRPPIQIYTDGACTGNPGPAGLGVVMMSGSHRKEVSEFLGEGTNNIAELGAILRGLELVRDRARTVIIYSDSVYSLGVINGWKAKANQALVARLRSLAGEFPDLRFIKVKGHAGIVENERCDELARDAITRRGPLSPLLSSPF